MAGGMGGSLQMFYTSPMPELFFWADKSDSNSNSKLWGFICCPSYEAAKQNPKSTKHI